MMSKCKSLRIGLASSPWNKTQAFGTKDNLKSLNQKHKKDMYILKSILNQAGAVWQIESIAMRKRDAERLLRSRLANANGKRRYGLFPSKS